MIQSLITVCPVDEKDDKIQKATGLVSSTSEALRSRVARPKFVQREPSFTEPRAPVKPPDPSSRLEDDEVRTRLIVLGIAAAALAIVGLIVLGSGQSAIVGLLFLIGAAAIFVGIGRFVSVEQAAHAEILRRLAEEYQQLVQAHRAAVQTARTRFELELQEWDAKKRRVQDARVIWEQSMYYCHRHDVVFLARGVEAARPEDMPALLGIGDIPVARDV